MNKNTPDGRAMPDDLAKKINERLNRKTLRPEDELVDALEELARDIALIEPDPEDWAGWITYLLEALQEQAERDFKRTKYETMLETLRDDLTVRMDGGKW